MQKPWPVQFELEVDHVHDGDTIYGGLFADAGLGIWIALGRVGTFWGVRLYGINAPELSTIEGKVCRDYLMSFVIPGDTLKVDSYSFDKYGGRIDGIPYTAAGVDLCATMLSFGHGTVVM